MVRNIRTNFITIALIKLAVVQSEPNIGKGDIYDKLKDHVMITDKEMFPYVVAILKMASYLSAGVMISDSWILTAADALYLVRESIRQLRVRIGSVNYKKGGLVLPIKYFHIHPYFDDRTPIYDLALLKLSQPITRTSYVRPIKLNKEMEELNTMHFIVTAWAQNNKGKVLNSKANYHPTEGIQRNRLLMVRQMHPTDNNVCRIQQDKLEIVDTGTLLCLDSSRGSDRCDRATGAPVIKNGVLWGIVSSWKREDCKLYPGPTFVNLVASPSVGLWIDAVIRDVHWKLQNLNNFKKYAKKNTQINSIMFKSS